jgi:hypothetical protein
MDVLRRWLRGSVCSPPNSTTSTLSSFNRSQHQSSGRPTSNTSPKYSNTRHPADRLAIPPPNHTDTTTHHDGRAPATPSTGLQGSHLHASVTARQLQSRYPQTTRRRHQCDLDSGTRRRAQAEDEKPRCWILTGLSAIYSTDVNGGDGCSLLWNSMYAAMDAVFQLATGSWQVRTVEGWSSEIKFHSLH